MIRDEHYKDVWFHLDCLNTEKGIRWRAGKAKEDSLYARYLDLISFGRKLNCPTCGEECEIYPKSSHRPEIWETVCTICGAVNRDGLSLLDYKHALLVNELKDLQQKYIHSVDPEISTKVEALAFMHGNFGKCECGGEYSIAAKSRCTVCYQELTDSYFHFAEC